MRLALNPVLERELRVRTRSWRTIIAFLFYLLLVGVVAWIAYESQRTTHFDPFSGITATETARVGRTIFDWTLMLLLLLVHFTVPGVVSGAIAGERERQTLVPLQVTLLRPRAIVSGKIGAAVAFIVLLVMATMPALAIGYLMGGVGAGEILRGIIAVLATTLVLACVAACCSAVARRVQTATVMAYALTLVMTIGSFAAYGAAAIVDDRRGNDPTDPPVALLYGAPIVGVSDFLVGTGDGSIDSPFDAIANITDPDRWWQDQPAEDNVPYWLESSIFLGIVSAGALAWASRRITTPGETER